MADTYLPRLGGEKWTQTRPLPSVGISMASTPTLRTPLASLLIRTASIRSGPEHLERKGWYDRAVGNRNDRLAADDAIPLGYDGKEAMPIRRPIKKGKFRNRCGKSTR